MKTVREISQDLGVSKTAVQNKITNELAESIGKFSERKGNTLYITKEGERLIKSKFRKIVSETKNEKFSETHQEVSEKTIESLLKQLDEKDKQIEEKDRQINELHLLQNQQQQLTAAALDKRSFLQKLLGSPNKKKDSD